MTSTSARRRSPLSSEAIQFPPAPFSPHSTTASTALPVCCSSQGLQNEGFLRLTMLSQSNLFPFPTSTSHSPKQLAAADVLSVPQAKHCPFFSFSAFANKFFSFPGILLPTCALNKHLQDAAEVCTIPTICFLICRP